MSLRARTSTGLLRQWRRMLRNARRGFLHGWAMGWTAGLAITVALGIAHGARHGWVGFIAGTLIFALVYLVGRRDGERAGIWEGEARAAKRQRDAIDAECDASAAILRELYEGTPDTPQRVETIRRAKATWAKTGEALRESLSRREGWDSPEAGTVPEAPVASSPQEELEAEVRAVVRGERTTKKMIGGVECYVEDNSGVERAARRVVRGE